MAPAVKICGLCTAADARFAVNAGADYLGVILSARGPRARSREQAREILRERGGAQAVGVFVDEAVDDVIATATALELDVVQLHGAESAASVRQIRSGGGWQVWKTIRLRDAEVLPAALAEWRHSADALLLEGYSERAHGGTGAVFDWQAAAASRDEVAPARLVVAGGLTPDNVSAAIAALRPDVVDVSSGVEEAVGRKSADLVRTFIARVHEGLGEAAR